MVTLLCMYSLGSSGDFNAVKAGVINKTMDLEQKQALASPPVSKLSFCMTSDPKL